jgi:hypothetical protein
MPTISYEKDIIAWSNEQVRLIREGRLSELDLANIAEEIADVGKSEKRELVSRMAVLLAHLMKWQYQPEFRGASWARTIKEQRNGIQRALKKTPSLKSDLSDADWVAGTWSDAVALAASETKLDNFPESCPWAIEDVLREGWLPETA